MEQEDGSEITDRGRNEERNRRNANVPRDGCARIGAGARM